MYKRQIINGNQLSVTADEHFNGSGAVIVTVSDGELTDTQTVDITVNPVNDIPVVEPIALRMEYESTIKIELLGSDIDGDDLDYSIISNSSYGSVTIDNDEVTYKPNDNFYGHDTFKYKANDGELDSVEAIVSITLLPNFVDHLKTYVSDPSLSDDIKEDISIWVNGTYPNFIERSNGTVVGWESLNQDQITLIPQGLSLIHI